MSWRREVRAHRGVHCNICGHSGASHGLRMTVIHEFPHPTYGPPEYAICGTCEKNYPTDATIYVHQFMAQEPDKGVYA